MSYLRRAKDTCGRYVQKPNQHEDNQNYDDTSIPLQDQIDNLRAKISLKQKYNKALAEEMNETNAGAATMITELIQQNKQLHEDLVFEKNAEKFAVKKALRSYRLFQLAVTEKDADSVINWLDDKIFDASKTLNEGIYLLKRMQNKLAEAEIQVKYMENCPVPGTEEWERKAEDEKVRLECAIEFVKANRDAALLLNKKYHDILFNLKGEKGKWPHTMESLERTLAQLRKELNSLETMLEDAIRFRDEASDKLKLVEEEASANRKQRRTQMNKMKKSVEKALEANTAKYTGEKVRRAGGGIEGAPSAVSTTETMTFFQQNAQEIKIKQAQVQEYESRVHRLVDAMRVRDLRSCPKRLSTVRKVHEILTEELNLKGELRQFLLNHKYRLELILSYFRYTGSAQEDRFKSTVGDRISKLDQLNLDVASKEKESQKKGSIFCDLHLALIGLEEILCNQARKKGPQRGKHEDLRVLMKKIGGKVRELVESVEALKKDFPEDSKPQRSYAPYVKFTIPPRYVRVGADNELEIDDDSDQEDIIDSKIPSRQDIKSKSEKIYSQGMLRRGLAK